MCHYFQEHLQGKINIKQNALSNKEDQEPNRRIKNYYQFNDKKIYSDSHFTSKKVGLAGRIKCHMCSEFVYKKCMQKHLDLHKIRPLWSCKLCSFSTLIHVKLKFHQNTNCGKDDFKCNNLNCSFMTKNYSLYYKHHKVSKTNT